MSLLRRVLVVTALLSLAPVTLARDDRPGSFAGVWTGHWSNSLGESGEDSLLLTEDPDGYVHGTWSGEVAVSGRQVRGSAIELRGETRSRSYLVTATVKGRKMSLTYVVTRLDGGGSYSGTARLVRPRGEGPRGASRMHLGVVWTVREPGGWRGTWVRRRGTTTLDAEWTNRDGETAQDVLEIESVRGDQVILIRRGDSLPGGSGRYTGTLSADGTTLQGTASWYAEGETWTATID